MTELSPEGRYQTLLGKRLYFLSFTNWKELDSSSQETELNPISQTQTIVPNAC